MSTILPVEIKPYLVHILWQLFEGKEFNYNGKEVKSIKIDLSSSIGRWIRSNCIKANRPPRAKHYNLIFELPNCSSAKYKGTAHQYVDGRNHFLVLPEVFIDDFNHFLEDLYRIRICAYIEAYDDHGIIKEGIRKLIEKYNLEEYGQNLDSIERLYHREKQKKKYFSRLQHNWTHNK